MRSDGLELASGRLGIAELVLSRGLCRFQRFDLARLPADKRVSALRLQLPQWSPFRDSDYAVVWNEGVASVWCWNSAALEASLSKVGRKDTGLRKIPETLLREPLVEGLRVAICLDGFEGQYWQASQLMVSRWWPQLPDSHAWQTFLRDCHLSAEGQIRLAPIESDLSLHPWAAIDSIGAGARELSLPELVLYGALSLALGIPTMALGLKHYRVGAAIDARKAEIAQIGERSRPLLEARDAALAAMAQANAINGLQRYPSPLMLMVAVARALPEGEAFLKEWEMSDGKLKILVSSPTAEIAGASYVSALEKARLFGDIKVLTQADPKQMGFVMALQPQRSLGLDEASAKQEQ